MEMLKQHELSLELLLLFLGIQNPSNVDIGHTVEFHHSLLIGMGCLMLCKPIELCFQEEKPVLTNASSPFFEKVISL